MKTKIVKGTTVYLPASAADVVNLSSERSVLLVGIQKSSKWAVTFGDFLAELEFEIATQNGVPNTSTYLAFVYLDDKGDFREFLDDFRDELWLGYVKDGLAIQLDRNMVGSESMKFFPGDYFSEKENSLTKAQIQSFLELKAMEIAYTLGVAQGVVDKVHLLPGYRKVAEVPVWTEWPPAGRKPRGILKYDETGLTLSEKRSDDIVIPWKFISGIGVADSEYHEQHGLSSTTHKAVTFSIDLSNGAVFERHYLLGSNEPDINAQRIYIRGFIRGIRRNRYPVLVVPGNGYVASGGYSVGVGVGVWF